MSELADVLEAGLAALRRGERIALATIVRARGSTPRHAGARMVIWPDGRIAGTVGGATLEQRVIEDALAVLREKRARLESYVFDTRGGEESVGLCGGAVDVYIEPMEPDPTLVIFGAGHIAKPLAVMTSQLGWRIVIVDDRAEYATRERFPEAAEIHIVEYEPKSETLAPVPAQFTPATYVVVATWGWDLPALTQILAGHPAYVGLVASKTKWRVIAAGLRNEGVPEQALARVRAPIGLDLGAETPAEVALAILSEMVAVRNGGSGSSMVEARQALTGPPTPGEE